MNYLLEDFAIDQSNAISKARRDVNYFVENFGFKPIGRFTQGSKFSMIINVIIVFFTIFKLKSNDVLFLQCSDKLLSIILFVKKIRNFKIVYLIHDIFCVRYTGNNLQKNSSEIEEKKKKLNQCDFIIAHNDIMIEKMKSLGFTSQLLNLEIFDYYTECPFKKRTFNVSEKVKLTFAGALTRNPFLQELDKEQHSFDFIIYGAPDPHFKNLKYMGSVNADILPDVIEGHFGLLWAEDYAQNLENNYMMYNNPHKMSLFIVSGLPIITWSKYAAANFVRENEIGICIDTLDELEDALMSVTPERYELMVNNCQKIRDRLVNGEHLFKLLAEINLLTS